MNVDLPPSSAFTPDPAVARAPTTRDTLTLAVEPEPGPVHIGHKLMSGNVRTGASCDKGSNSFRAGIAPAEEVALTITF